MALRETLLRISGAIQVPPELLNDGGAVPSAAVSQSAALGSVWELEGGP